MDDFQKYFDMALAFHGHKCPAMPMGLKAGLAALRTLGVDRCKSHELFVEAETGKGHAAGCFLDGIMAATGCTYGKSNIQKLYYNKLAFTLIEVGTGRAVRVSIKPAFLARALESPFIQQRKKGVPPHEIPAQIADPLIDRIRALPDEQFLDIGEVHVVKREQKKGIFEARPCSICGEITFIDKLRLTEDGRDVCIPCSGYGA